MNRRLLVLAVVCAAALVGLCIPVLAAQPAGAGNAPPEAAESALKFANSLANGDLTAGWRLLSAGSRSQISAVQWEEAFRSRGPARMPSGNDLLRTLANADQPPTIGDALVGPAETLVAVSGTVRVTEQLALVKEGGAWLIDLPASDQNNSREAAQVFVEAVRSGSATPRPTRTAESSLPMLRVVMTPEAKDFYLLDASVTGDRAEVTVACDIPVSVVLRAVRSGAGWMVDLARPLVNTSPTSPDPLKEAAESNIQATCQDQLRQLAQALQMYAAANNDMFPDPDHWVERIRPYVGGSGALHCPADKTPGVSYAMNRNLAGKKRSLIANAPTTPMLYESTLHAANSADTGESWPSQAFHAAGNMVVFVDGSARPMTAKPSFEVTEGARPTPLVGQPQPSVRRQPGAPRPRPPQ
jgi:hypothetical protein